jgi:DUF4097 and DUF4098 domain-containing protein YvlB
MRDHHGGMLERLRITVTSGTVRVVGEDRDDLAVEGAVVTGQEPDLELHGTSGEVTARLPTTTAVVLGSLSGKVQLEGRVGAVSVTTTSAAVRAEDVASIDARSTSGKLRVGNCRGDLRMKTKSSSVVVGRVDGEVVAATVSGRITIDDARGPVAVKTVSGTVEITVDGSALVRMETISGKLRVHVPAGVRPDVRVQSVSGKARIDVEQGDDVVLMLRTVSGSIEVKGP